jgi:translation initiation factor IF-2
MAKIRVYELARDLNMTNKDLLAKLKEIDISISSHMGSLDEEMVAQVKSAIHGKKPLLEETRVRPTVIRRRKKRVKPVVEVPEKEAEAAEKAALEATVPQKEKPETEPQPEPKVAKKVAKRPKKVAKKTEPAAKVIRKPAASEVAEEPVLPKTKESVPPPVETAARGIEAETVPTPKEPTLGEPPEAVESVVELKAPPSKTVKPEAPKAKKVKAKKGKKEEPAKIIRRAELGAVPSQEKPAETANQLPASQRVTTLKTPQPATEDKKARKKKGKKKISGEPGQERKFFKKKIAFRRREVIEGRDLYSAKQRGRKGRKGAKAKAALTAQKTQITTAKAIKRRIKMDETIILAELAKRMGIKANEMIVKLMGMGVMATVNQTIDFETAALVASEFDYEVEKATFEEETILKVETEEDPDKLIARPPVVTIMGHVDHGKTSLLDVIRKTRVTEHEAGGITQHIGAYHVPTDKEDIVFLDTPGHEAFSAMRSRGAKVTDIVVLVVAADDGVMPQTIEAINHSKAAEVPIIVAVNKMDKAEADPERVKRELTEYGLAPEDWGGDAIFVEVSAKMNQGIDELLEMINLQSEMLELKANPDKLARGHVVEAKLDSGRGPVATILVQEGTLKTGDSVVCGIHYGKVRALLSDRGKQVNSAGPSIPVEIVGLTGVPTAGDEMVSLKDEKQAKQVSLHRVQKQRSKELAKSSRLSLDSLFEKMQEGELKDLNLIIKADVDGSIEALRDSLTKLSNEEVNINITHSATGTITESDIFLAAGSNAIIIGFNVRPNTKVQEMAKEENVDIRYYNIIYNVIKEVKDAIVGMMESTFEERVIGKVEVREVFHVPKVGAIAGSYVTEGRVERGQLMRLLRDGIVIYEGKNASLRRFKDDVKEVQNGYECGIGIENYNDIKIGDVIECYYLEEIKPAVE